MGMMGHPRKSRVATQKSKHLESETLRQQAAGNSKEQFAHSPDFHSEFMNAVMGAQDAHTQMSTQTLNSKAVQEGMKHILLQHSGLWEALRAAAASQKSPSLVE